MSTVYFRVVLIVRAFVRDGSCLLMNAFLQQQLAGAAASVSRTEQTKVLRLRNDTDLHRVFGPRGRASAPAPCNTRRGRKDHIINKRARTLEVSLNANRLSRANNNQYRYTYTPTHKALPTSEPVFIT